MLKLGSSVTKLFLEGRPQLCLPLKEETRNRSKKGKASGVESHCGGQIRLRSGDIRARRPGCNPTGAGPKKVKNVQHQKQKRSRIIILSLSRTLLTLFVSMPLRFGSNALNIISRALQRNLSLPMRFAKKALTVFQTFCGTHHPCPHRKLAAYRAGSSRKGSVIEGCKDEPHGSRTTKCCGL